jgi:hypothetical protein
MGVRRRREFPVNDLQFLRLRGLLVLARHWSQNGGRRVLNPFMKFLYVLCEFIPIKPK